MSENKSLSTIVSEMSVIVSAIIENGGELTPELESAFDNVGTDLATKCDGYAVFMERLETEADYWKAKADSYSKVSKSCKALKERLNDNIKFAMRTLNTDEVKGGDVRFKLSKLAPKVVLNEEKIPQEYKMQVTEWVPDKERIKVDLQNGCAIEGAGLEDVYSLRKYANKKVGA
jgi:hypothetical protein